MNQVMVNAVELQALEDEVKDLRAQLKRHNPKEWVGLTEEEIADYWVDAFNDNGLYVQRFARIIEDKLKEKNA